AVGLGAGAVWLWQRAEGARETAVTAQSEAETARDAEQAARATADKARGEADRARDAEMIAHKQVEREREKLEVFEYGWVMHVAHQEWRDGNITGVRVILNRTKPELRGWEWHHVHRLCNGSLLTLRHTRGVPTSGSFSPDGSRIVTGSEDRT